MTVTYLSRSQLFDFQSLLDCNVSGNNLVQAFDLIANPDHPHDSRSLFSIEPYPALSTTQLASIAPNKPMSAEIRQLSATPTASATPAPIMRRGRDLFRSATTPLDYGYAEDDEEGAVRLREASAKLAADMDSEDSDYLPTLDERRTTRSARGV